MCPSDAIPLQDEQMPNLKAGAELRRDDKVERIERLVNLTQHGAQAVHKNADLIDLYVRFSREEWA